MHFNIFHSFSLMIHTCYGIFTEIFALFLAQNFKTKVLTAPKNLLLECLVDRNHNNWLIASGEEVSRMF